MTKLTDEGIEALQDIGEVKYLLRGLRDKYVKLLQAHKGLEKNVATLTEQLRVVKLAQRELMIERDSAVGWRFDAQFAQLRGDFIEYLLQRLLQMVHGSDPVDELSSFRERLDGLQTDVQNALGRERQRVAELASELGRVQLELTMVGPRPAEADAIVAEKDRAISRLRGLLQQSLAETASVRARCEETQRELSRMSEAMADLPTSPAPALTVPAGSPSAELEALLAENRRLQAMLAAAHARVSEPDWPILALSRCLAVQVPERAEPFGGAAVRKALLQFFLADEAQQELLLPSLLGLVGCNQHEVVAAGQALRRGRQFISRIFG